MLSDTDGYGEIFTYKLNESIVELLDKSTPVENTIRELRGNKTSTDPLSIGAVLIQQNGNAVVAGLTLDTSKFKPPSWNNLTMFKINRDGLVDNNFGLK